MGIDFGSARNVTTWEPEPNGRGTYGILSSCIITMVLCVWTAVHLNIPEHKSANPRQNVPWWKGPTQGSRRLGFVLLGLFAPEIVAWIAFEQNTEARIFHRKMKVALGEKGKHVPSGLQRLISKFRGIKKSDVESAAPAGDGGVGGATAARAHKWTMTRKFSVYSIHGYGFGGSWLTSELVDSHYAAMGGFVFDSNILGVDLLPGGRKRVTLTNKGILRLAEDTPHLIPDISAEHIRDKSKASYLAKMIVTLQAIWFAAQCISRLALGMTISLLELNTLAHAICALLAYALWWHKPLDVEEPTLIQGADDDLICGGFCMRSHLGVSFWSCDYDHQHKTPVQLLWKNVRPDNYRNAWDKWNRSIRHFISGTSNSPPIPLFFELVAPVTIRHGDPWFDNRRNNWKRKESEPDNGSPPRYALYSGQSIYEFGYPPLSYPQRPFRALAERYGVLSLHRPVIDLTSQDVQRLRLAQACYSKYPSLLDQFVTKPTPHHTSPGHTILEWIVEYVVDRSPNLPIRGILRSNPDDPRYYSIFFSLFVSGMAYGGAHLAAWNPPVRTAAETLMWRLSGLCLIGYGVAIPIFIMLLDLRFTDLIARPIYKYLSVWSRKVLTASWLAPLWRSEYGVQLKRIKHSCHLLLKRFKSWMATSSLRSGVVSVVSLAVLYFFGLLTLLYLLCRVYLVVECFISIPRLPASVFETPEWSLYLPHLG